MKSHPTTTGPVLLLFFTMVYLLCTPQSFAQLLDGDDFNSPEITVSKAHLQYDVAGGETQSQTVEISNNTEVTQTFRVAYQDFELSTEGEPRFMESGSSEHSLAPMLDISPEMIEVGPGKTAEVSITVSAAENAESPGTAWGIVMIEQLEADQAINEVETGLASTLAYGVWLYKNPPEAKDRQVDITNFIVGNKERNKGVFLKVKNKGNGISICNAYVEITNLTTGELILIEGKQYTILPGARRTLLFELDQQLPKGSYSALGVIDYENQEDLVATELEFKID